MTELTVPEPRRVFDLTMEDGAIIRVRQHGNPDGVRIVLSHGNGFAIDGYVPFWGLLTERFEIVLYDQRNHGHNPRHLVEHHDVPYFVKDMERVFHGIQEELGRKTTVGALHSISGITSIWHAVEVGWRWDALVLFDPPLVASPGHPLNIEARDHELQLAEWSLTRPNRFDGPSEMAAQFAKSYRLRRWVEGEFELMAGCILRPAEDGDGYALCCPREGESKVYETNAYLDLCPRLPELKGPVKFICSDADAKDTRAPGRIGLAMHQEYGIAYEAIPDTSHLLQVERPAEVARSMLDFLSECGIG